MLAVRTGREIHAPIVSPLRIKTVK